jgi:hypothetical protein
MRIFEADISREKVMSIAYVRVFSQDGKSVILLTLETCRAAEWRAGRDGNGKGTGRGCGVIVIVISGVMVSCM